MLEFDAASHRYTWNGAPVPGVTQVIRSALGDPFASVPRDALERKRQIGVAAHKACELDALGKLDDATVHTAVLPYLEAWRAFVRESGFAIAETEKTVHNGAHGYAGRLDFLGLIGGCNGVPTVIDLKSGLPNAATALQTAAYAACVPGLPWRFALQALPTGRYKLVEYTNPGDFADFLACLRVYRLKERMAA